MKVVKFLIFLAALIGIFSVSIIVLPFHLYKVAIESGIQSNFIKIAPASSFNLSPLQHELKGYGKAHAKERALWETLHMANYKVPFPVGYPGLIVQPNYFEKNKKFYAGLKYTRDFKFVPFSYVEGTSFTFDREISGHLLFELPIFRNYIDSKTTLDVWNDMLRLKVKKIPFNFEFISVISNLDLELYKGMVYNLYILKLREKYFEKDFERLSYDPVRKMTLVKRRDLADSSYSNEELWFFDGGEVQRMTITFANKSKVAQSLRMMFLHEVSFSLNGPDSTVHNYSLFRSLPFNERVGMKGNMYLLSAWSHDSKSDRFAREIVYYLERGRKGQEYLNPYYKIFYSLYGSTFSSREKDLRETASMKLKRGLEEEKDQEFKNYREEGIVDSEEFITPKERLINVLNQEVNEQKDNTLRID